LNLRALQKHWNSLGRHDPLRAILARSKNKEVPWNVEHFFRSGVLEIDMMLRYAESFRPFSKKEYALDFGCGVGRLTQAIATQFNRVVGVDLSPAMIEHARNYLKSGSHVEYVLNETPDLRLFRDAKFDLVYSSITLQHMPARFAKRYIAEFLRVLNPDGMLLFQVPSRRKGNLPRLRTQAHELFGSLLQPIVPRVVMRGIQKQEVVTLLTQHGGEILDIADDQSAGPTWESYRYLVQKAPQSRTPSP
jgi:ubiquinone/menaquinone biosynthesis C-methylase UbiE